MSLTGDALYTPLVEESMLPFWYLFGRAIVKCRVCLSIQVEMLNVNCCVFMQVSSDDISDALPPVVMEGSLASPHTD
jgi:hypothetical protein